MTTPADGACLREVDEHLTIHPSLAFLPFEVEYLGLFFPPFPAPGVPAQAVAPARLAVQNDDDENNV